MQCMTSDTCGNRQKQLRRKSDCMKRFKINGSSTEPLIKDGDYVITKSKKNLRTGDIVVFNHEGKILVKRISGISADSYELHGDNSHTEYHATDNSILGKVIVKIASAS